MNWLNFITGVETAKPAAALTSGQLQWIGSSETSLGRVLVSPQDWIFSSLSGAFLSTEFDAQHVDPRTIPDLGVQKILTQMKTLLEKNRGATFSDWCSESPLMPEANKFLEESELETILKEKLFHLEQVCRAPISHLKINEERQLINRCKRPSSRAPSVLAAHSEDWAKKTLWGIQPKRILGLVHDDLYNFYENQICASLVDNLEKALTERIREIQRVVRQRQSIEKWQAALETKNHHRAKRMSQLWGDLWVDGGMLSQSTKALLRVTTLRRRVRALTNSLLYRKAAKRKGLKLRMTNIFSDQSTYRNVADIWRAWQRETSSGSADPQEGWKRIQAATIGMHYYGYLTVLKALDDLGCIPVEEDLETGFGLGKRLTLGSDIGNLTLYWAPDGGLELEPPVGDSIRITSIPSLLAGSDGIESWMESLPADENLMILHLDSELPKAVKETQTRLRGPGPKDHPITFVSIAPWELESVERVARALRWRIWGPVYLEYPMKIRKPRDLEFKSSKSMDWLIEKDSSFEILKPPVHLDFAELDGRIEGLKSEIREIESKISKKDEKHLKKKIADLKKKLTEIETFKTQLNAKAQSMQDFLCCPICRVKNDIYSFENTENLFNVSCTSCKAKWGLTDCSSCKTPFPFLDNPSVSPSDKLEDQDLSTSHLLNVDSSHGCDVLAFPNGPGYYCSHCGQ